MAHRASSPTHGLMHTAALETLPLVTGEAGRRLFAAAGMAAVTGLFGKGGVFVGVQKGGLIVPVRIVTGVTATRLRDNPVVDGAQFAVAELMTLPAESGRLPLQQGP